MIEIFIDGKPQGKARPRFANGHAYTPKATKDYEEYVKWCYVSQGGKKYTGAVKVKIEAKFKQPNAFQWGEVTKRPDADNIAKIILDGLAGVAYDNDKQVTELMVTKTYGVSDVVIVTIGNVDEME